MGLVYVVADQQCVLVFASHRHSSYRFGFLRVGPRRPSPVVYNTVRGTVERPRRRGPRGSDTARGSNAVWSSSTTTRSRRRRSEYRDRSATPDPGVHPPAARATASGSGCKKSDCPGSTRAGRHVCETERRKAEPCGESTVLAPPGDGGTAAARARARLGR
jgi:hypothetical protein